MFHTLVISSICIFLTWYVYYHWKRKTLPFIGNGLYFGGTNTDIFNNFMRLTKEYESPARLWFGQKLMFVVWKPNDIQTILTSPHALEKTELYKFAETLTGTGLFTASVPTWKLRRKIILPTLTPRILEEFVEIFSEKAEILVKQLKMEVGQGTFDIIHYLGRCSLDMVCETSMGVTINAQTTKSNFYNWINKALEIIVKRMFGIFYHFDFIFNRTSMAKEQLDVINKINAFAGDVLTKKKTDYRKKAKERLEQSNQQIAEEPRKSNFLQLLVELSEEGANLKDEEILDETKTLLIGGTESTASAEGFIFILLGMYPDIQDKVYKEVIDVLGPDRPVEHTDLEKLRYLEMVIKEALRIFPIGQLVSRNIAKDIKLENCIVPAGSFVIIFLTPPHRDPEVWPNPLKFDPNRFLPEEVEKRHPYSWIPFIGGLRKCIGATYSMMAMKAVIATVIRKYKFSTDYKSVEDIKLKIEIALKPVDGFRVSLESRG